jgi:hypothetical protein
MAQYLKVYSVRLPNIESLRRSLVDDLKNKAGRRRPCFLCEPPSSNPLPHLSSVLRSLGQNHSFSFQSCWGIGGGEQQENRASRLRPFWLNPRWLRMKPAVPERPTRRTEPKHDRTRIRVIHTNSVPPTRRYRDDNASGQGRISRLHTRT